MIDLEWEKKQFEKWAVVTAEKREFLVPDDTIHFDWSAKHCPELVNDSRKQSGFCVWSLRDYWEGWLARAELTPQTCNEDHKSKAATQAIERSLAKYKRDYDKSLEPLRAQLKLEMPCKECGVARKLHVGREYKCPKKK